MFRQMVQLVCVIIFGSMFNAQFAVAADYVSTDHQLSATGWTQRMSVVSVSMNRSVNNFLLVGAVASLPFGVGNDRIVRGQEPKWYHRYLSDQPQLMLTGDVGSSWRLFHCLQTRVSTGGEYDFRRFEQRYVTVDVPGVTINFTR